MYNLELYVNGKPVAKNAVPFTPFNSHAVRFKASYPMTYAIKVVDWEENPGLGTEDNKGNKYHPGDAGIVAVFSDGTVTDAGWKAQAFYIAPLMSKSDLVIETKDGRTVRSTSKASPAPACTTKCYAAHFKVPEAWYSRDFNDSAWPAAKVYKTEEVGVDNKSEYTKFKSEFGKGSFIWTSNLCWTTKSSFAGPLRSLLSRDFLSFSIPTKQSGRHAFRIVPQREAKRLT